MHTRGWQNTSECDREPECVNSSSLNMEKHFPQRRVSPMEPHAHSTVSRDALVMLNHPLGFCHQFETVSMTLWAIGPCGAASSPWLKLLSCKPYHYLTQVPSSAHCEGPYKPHPLHRSFGAGVPSSLRKVWPLTSIMYCCDCKLNYA